MKPVFRIQRYSVHDGPGIRTTLFFQGCPLRCIWCHNPESQQMLPSHGAMAPRSSADLDPWLEEVMEEIKKDEIFYDESGGGVTLSGGEPLVQPGPAMAILSVCRRLGFHTCLDTSGFAPFPIIEEAAEAADLVLYDLKLMDGDDHRKYTGVDSARVLKNLQGLSQMEGVDLRLRFPLIPGITDTRANVAALARFVLEKTRFREIHILPFHNTAAGKYETLDMAYELDRLSPPEPEQVESVRNYFETKGFTAHIGG